MNPSSLYPWVIDAYDGRERGEHVDAMCPLCGKRKLWFHLGSDNALVLKCWLGCDKSEILRCTGREFKHCFAGTPPERPKQEVTATYKYLDEGGSVLFLKDRLEPGMNGKSKDFRVRRQLPDGRWAVGLKAGRYMPKREGGKYLYRSSGVDTEGVDLLECRRVLYNLPQVLNSNKRQLVYASGEKDCDTLFSLDFVATTCDKGESSGWNREWSLLLRGRHVAVIEDADETGAKFADTLVGSLLWGGAASVRRVRLEHKDVTRFVSELRAKGIREKAKLRSAVVEQLNKGAVWECKKN